MMKVITRLFLIGLLLSLVGCPRRTSRTDSGGVLLSLTKFDKLPIDVSVDAAGGYVQIGKLTLQNVPADPNGTTSNLMNVELDSYSVTYTRADQGTRLPPKLVEKAFGVVPVGGTDELDNFVVVSPDQFDNPPLSDLFYSNGGYDKETGSAKITLNLTLQFFGHTLSGDKVASAPSSFTLDFFP